MGSNIETLLTQISNKLDVMANKWSSDETRVRTLEHDPRNQYPRNFLPRTVNPREHYNESYTQNHQYSPDLYKEDDCFIRNVKVEAPSFVDRSDPIEYINWEVDMDQYFSCNEMSEGRKVRFAQMKLLGRAKRYWQHVQSVILYRRQESISWDVMKQKLREKYVPISYQKYLPIQRPKIPHSRPTTNQDLVPPLPIKKNVKEEKIIEDISGLGQDVENNEERVIEETVGLGHHIENQSPLEELQFEELKSDDTRKETLQEFSSNGLDPNTSQCPSEELHAVELENVENNLKTVENEIEEEVYIADPELAEIYEQYETTQIQETLETDPDIQEQETNLIEEKEPEEEPINDTLSYISDEKKLIEEPTNDILICNMETKELIEEPTNDILIYNIETKEVIEEIIDSSLVCNLEVEQEPGRYVVPLDQTLPKLFGFHDPFTEFFSDNSPNNFFIFQDIQCSEFFLDTILFNLLFCQLNPLNRRSCMDKFLSALKNGLRKAA